MQLIFHIFKSCCYVITCMTNCMISILDQVYLKFTITALRQITVIQSTNRKSITGSAYIFLHIHTDAQPTRNNANHIHETWCFLIPETRKQRLELGDNRDYKPHVCHCSIYCADSFISNSVCIRFIAFLLTPLT